MAQEVIKVPQAWDGCELYRWAKHLRILRSNKKGEIIVKKLPRVIPCPRHSGYEAFIDGLTAYVEALRADRARRRDLRAQTRSRAREARIARRLA